jgi:hypothetical protein
VHDPEDFDTLVRKDFERAWVRARRAHKRGDWEQLARVVYEASGLLAVAVKRGREVVVPERNLVGLTGHVPLRVGEAFFAYLDMHDAILEERFRAEDRIKAYKARSEERALGANWRIGNR